MTHVHACFAVFAQSGDQTSTVAIPSEFTALETDDQHLLPVVGLRVPQLRRGAQRAAGVLLFVGSGLIAFFGAQRLPAMPARTPAS
jgi:hypothetical protein